MIGSEDTFWRAKRGKIWLLAYIGAIVTAVSLGILMYRGRVVTVKTQAPPSPIGETTPRVPETNLAQYTLTILNGSGIKGEAVRARVRMEREGFSVLGTGNADSYNYKETMIEAKNEVSADFLGKLRESLGVEYQVATAPGILVDTATSSVVVIIGSSKQ